MTIRRAQFLAGDSHSRTRFLIGELARILVLGALVLSDCRTFILNIGANIGGADAKWYQYMLHDAIIQLNNGLFPSFLGQSEYAFFGEPYVRAPYYLFLGQALNAVTLNSLSALHIQHLTVIFSALLGAYLLYYLLSRLAPNLPNLRWAAVCFAYFYVSCPGVLGLIYRLDMYLSFMALPFIPLAFYGLIKAYRDRDNNGYVITGVALSLVWLAHPPIAVWTSAACMLFLVFQILSLGRGIGGIFTIGLVVLLLNLWQFVAVVEFQLTEVPIDVLGYANTVTHFLRSDFPASLIPLSSAMKEPGATIPYLQLGYALWFAVGLGVLASAARRRSAPILTLLCCVILLSLFLYPLPVIGDYLWDALPQQVKTLTFLWPQQRLYMVIAALSCFVGMLALAQIARNGSQWTRNAVFAAIALAVFWTMHQVQYFQAPENIGISTSALWSADRNPYFFGRYILGSQEKMPFEGEYDPLLKNRLLDSDKQRIEGFDNEIVIARKCLDGERTAAERKLFEPDSYEPFSVSVKNGRPATRSLGNLSLPEQATQFVLCLKLSEFNFSSSNKKGRSLLFTFRLDGNDFHVAQQLVLDAHGGERLVSLPFYVAGRHAGRLKIEFAAATDEEASFTVSKYGVLAYTKADLPIKIDAYTSYRSTVTAPSENGYLEVFKQYQPGYRARVNDQETAVLESPNSTVLIPLKDQGANRIKLSYAGTTAMRFALLTSVVGWLLVIFYLYKAGEPASRWQRYRYAAWPVDGEESSAASGKWWIPWGVRQLWLVAVRINRNYRILIGELARILVLGVLVLYDFSTFIQNIGANIGGSDAKWYQYILHDAIIQLNNGLFPNYLGQSQYAFFGETYVRAPYYLFLGQALNAVTLNSLSSLHIQHLTVICSALLGAYLFYFLLSRLAPNLRWAAVCFAYFYVSCPGVLGIIHNRLDMYFSYMTLPFIPLAFYGLIKAYSDRENNGYVITGVALSLVWMAHPPIAVWTSAVCVLFLVIQILSLKRGIGGIVTIGSVVLLLNLWQFVSVFELQLTEIPLNLRNFVKIVTGILRSDFPASLFPLNYAMKVPGTTIPYLQLGYALWFAIGLGILVSATAQRSALVISLLCCLTCLFLFLYPVPLLGNYLWDALPRQVKTMMAFWPQQRLYIVIAALSCFVGMLALAHIARNSSKWTRNAAFVAIALSVFWNMHQVQYVQAPERTGISNSALWSADRNPYFFGRYVVVGSVEKMPFEGEYDPLLKNGLLDSDKKRIDGFDNETVLVRKCLDDQRTASRQQLFEPDSDEPFSVSVKNGRPATRNLGNLNVPGQATQFVLCLKLANFNSGSKNRRSPLFTFRLVGNDVNVMHQLKLDADGGERFVLLPFYGVPRNAGPLRIEIAANASEDTSLTVSQYGVLAYSAVDLPIKIDAYTPYRSTVTAPSENGYLEVFKQYLPGYRARVNDEGTTVLESPDSTVLIPLRNKGANRIELSYAGTITMRVTFVISLVAWLLVLFYFYKSGRRHVGRR